MAYNKYNFLTKVAKIQSIVAIQDKKGVTKLWTYENLIKDQFDISYSTFNNYLAIYVKGELDELDRKETERKRQRSQQLSLVF